MVMNSRLVWTVFAAVVVMLGAVGYHFSLRTLRWVALIVALATAVYLIVYGLTHAPNNHSSLSDDFAQSADALSSALIRPLSLGHDVPAPGWI
jgi:arginine exporter protein ArgO